MRDGRPTKGMPPQPMPVADRSRADPPPAGHRAPRAAADRRTVETTDGRTSTASCSNEGFDDLQLRTDDNRVHLLAATGDAFRP